MTPPPSGTSGRTWTSRHGNEGSDPGEEEVKLTGVKNGMREECGT